MNRRRFLAVLGLGAGAAVGGIRREEPQTPPLVAEFVASGEEDFVTDVVTSRTRDCVNRGGEMEVKFDTVVINGQVLPRIRGKARGLME